MTGCVFTGSTPRLLCLLILFAAAATVDVQARAQTEEPAPPIDERETWRVGVLPFDTVDLLPEELSLGRTVPLLILDALSALREHRLDAAERDARRKQILDGARLSAGRALDREIRTRDRLLFADITAETRAARLESADERVTAARSEYRRLADLDVARIEVPGVKPVELRPGAGELLPASRSARTAAREGRLDFVLSGAVERLDDEFLILELFGYCAARERTVLQDTLVLRPEEIAEQVDQLIDRAAEVVLGRQWAHLTVRSTETDAAVQVDGVLYGFGAVTVQYLEPGPRDVRVSHEGREQTQTVVLLPFERAEVELDFPVAVGDTITIESEPAGADIYLDSVWVGRTPADIARPRRPSTVVLQRDGFHTSRFPLRADSPDRISRNLAPDVIGWSELTLEQRDRFYRSLGFFVVSLPVPIILYGVYDNLATFFVAGTPPGLDPGEADRLVGVANTVQGAYWVSVGVSTGLFVNMAVQLVRYIRAAESYHFH